MSLRAAASAATSGAELGRHGDLALGVLGRDREGDLDAFGFGDSGCFADALSRSKTVGS